MSSLLARNTFYLTSAAIGQKIIAFVYFLFLARIMQPESTGVYFLSVSLVTIFSVIADFGVTPVIIREIAKYPEKVRRLVREALGTKIPFILIAMISAVITSIILGYDPLIVQLVIIASVVLALDSIHLLFYGALRGVQKLQYESLGIFVGQLSTAALGGLVLWLNPSLHLLILALMLGSSVNVLVSSRKVIKEFGRKTLVPVFSLKRTKTLLKIALPFALAAIFVKVYSYIDSIFISKFLGTLELGLYSVAYKFTYAFQFLPLAFTAALYPGLSANVAHDQSALKQMLMRGMWYMMILATPIVLGLWVIAPEAVLLAGESYASSAPVLRVLIFVLIPIFLDFPIGSLLNAANRQTTKTAIMGITMVLNVILNAVLIPQHGLMGAAIAGIASFTFLFLAGLYFVHKIIPSFSHLDLIRTIFPIALSGGIMLIATIALKPIVGWIGIIPIAAIIYFISLFVLGSIKKSDFLQIKKLIRG